MLDKLNQKKFISPRSFIIMITGITVAVFYLIFSYNSLQKLLLEMLMNISNQGVVAVKSNINEKVSIAEIISNSKLLSSNDVPLQEKFRKIEELTNFKEYHEFYIIDLLGKAISSDGREIDVSKFNFFKKAVSGVSNVSQPIKLSDNDEWVSFIAVPNRDIDGKIIGILAYSIPAEMLDSLVENISLMQEGTSFIVDRSGNIVAGDVKHTVDAITSPTQKNYYTDTNYSSLLNFIDEVITNSTGFGEYNFRNTDRIAVYQPIENTDWLLVTSSPKDIALSSVWHIFIILSIFVIIVLILTLLLSFYLINLSKTLSKEKRKSDIAISAANLITTEINIDGTVIYVNDYFLTTSGYTEEEVINTNFCDLIPEGYVELYKQYLYDVINGTAISDLDLPILKKDGSLIHVLWNSSFVTQNGKIERLDFVGTNISKLKEYQSKIHKLAYYDTLTELRNRTSLEDFVSKTIKENIKMAIMYLDFDNFKFINDSYGHMFGDKYIIEVCKRILSQSTDDTFIFRIGGDEIVIVYKDPEDYSVVGDFGNIILNLICSEYNIDNIKIYTTCSMGISMFPNDGNDFGEVFKAAEIAMNKAKEMGKARITFYNSNMKKELIDAVLLENDLKEAVKNDEFILYYQPQYDIESGELCGFEALIRWISPTRGFVSPAVFIPATEKNQLIIPIGETVLRKSAEFAKEISEMTSQEIPISVNVSFAQLLNDEFVASIISTINRVGAKFSTIKLELTESVLMESIDIGLLKINELHSKGIKFALDDFGTGYSSLTYLKKLPIQLLKIDKSFVDTILDSRDEDKEILSSIITLAHSIGIKVVAEGVEEKIQLDWLRKKECNICQGYYTGKPMPRDEAIKLIGKNIYS